MQVVVMTTSRTGGSDATKSDANPIDSLGPFPNQASECLVENMFENDRMNGQRATRNISPRCLQEQGLHRGRPFLSGRPKLMNATFALLLLHVNLFWSVQATKPLAYSEWTEAGDFGNEWNTAENVPAASTALRQRTRRDLTVIQRLNFYLGAEHSLHHDGLRRWFMEHQPANMATDGSTPLLITLHCGQGNMRSSYVYGRTGEKDPWLKLAWEQRFLVLSPNAASVRKYFSFLGLNTHGFVQDWNDLLGGGPSGTGADDVGFIAALIDWAVAERNIDRSRVYVTGISNGATMVQRLLIERPELFASAASFVGNLPERDITLPSMGTPFFLMNGTEDPIMPYNGGASSKNRGMVRSAEATRDFFVAANQAGPTMVETMMPDLDTDDGCRVISQYFPSDTAPVQYYRLQGGGHQPAKLDATLLDKVLLEWYVGKVCRDMDSVGIAWQFMSQYTRTP